MNNSGFLYDRLQEAPVVTLVDSLLSSAIDQGASDIHIDPALTSLRVRVRVDGILHDAQTIVDEQLVLRLVSRLKVLSGMDITQKRLPQDGKFSAHIGGRHIDFRVSTFPVLYGEKVAIRILDRSAQMVQLNRLGFSEHDLKTFERLLAKPQGCILVCGPTGSGKTTTLYCALARINTADKNIMTLEDPIEYELPGITQAAIHPEAGFTFAAGMRSIVRHDPDVIMVGEIRDPQTAAIAHQAALTGHLVLSTVHTNDSIGVIARLAAMDIEPYLMSATLSGILSQRLVRVLCGHCKEEQKLEMMHERFFMCIERAPFPFYKAVGCNACYGTGYKSRMGLFELVVVTKELAEGIARQDPYDELVALAVKHGTTLLFNDGLNKLQLGHTSFDELLRVVGPNKLL